MVKKRKLSYSKFPFLKALKSKDRWDRYLEARVLKPYSDKKEYISSLEVTKEEEFFTGIEESLANIDYFSSTYEKAVRDSSHCISETIYKETKNGEENAVNAIFNILKIDSSVKKQGIAIIKYSDVAVLYTIYNFAIYNNTPYIFGMTIYESSKKYTSIIDIFQIYEIHIEKVENNVFGLRFGKSSEITPSPVMGGKAGVLRDVQWLISLLIFKEIAQTEIEEVEIVDDSKLPKGLSSLQKQYKMNSLEGDITVNFYDANWYTEIIRNEGFSVRGHWRNQPTKDGYKLIFIKPFEKKGYHRRASKDM